MKKLDLNQMENVVGGTDINLVCGGAAITVIVGLGFGNYWAAGGALWSWIANECYTPQYN